MAKEIKFSEKARRSLLKGVDKLADTEIGRASSRERG